jgi:uncharacterized membrane protein
MKEIRVAFVTGVLVLVPVVATINLLIWFVGTVEGSVRKFLPTTLFPVDFPGFALILALGIILLVGMAAKNHLGMALFHYTDAILKRTPLIGGIHSTIRKFLEAVLNPRSNKFHGVVLVPFPSPQLLSIGFRTGNPDKRLGLKENHGLINVFVPCTPNPTSGFYLLVKESDTIAMDISVQDAFKIVVSMGIVSLDEKGTPPTL